MSGAELRARRDALGLTQQQLADRFGCTRVAISCWEGGVMKIQRPKMLDLALRALEAETKEQGR